MKMRYLAFVLLLGALLTPAELSARLETAYSPNREIALNVDVKDGIPIYNVTFKGQQIIRDSRLGLELASVKSNSDFSNFDNRQSVGPNSPGVFSASWLGKNICVAPFTKAMVLNRKLMIEYKHKERR